MKRNSRESRDDDAHTRGALRSGADAVPERMDPAASWSEEALRLVHELQVHQVELETQNEELKRVQSELEASRARYVDLYDQAPAGYVTVSAQGFVLEANLAAAALLGMERGALVKRPFASLVHPDDRDTYRRHRANLGEEGGPDAWEMTMARADGSPCWVHLQAALTPDGECRVTLNDITDRKRMEATLARADARMSRLQKAESLHRMAGAIAHHFNNKLQAVMGNLDMAMRGQAACVVVAGFLADAMKAARQAAEMSTLMLTFVGQAAGELRPMDLSGSCRRLLPLLRAALPASIALETDLPSPGPTVKAHEEQLPQLLMNLVSNAGDALKGRTGSVRLSVTTVSPSMIPEVHRYPVDWEPGNTAYACLEVVDTGRGLADKDVERIFDPFFTDKELSRGLGLPVVLGIVRTHGGAVCVWSEPGLGSALRVFLPLSPGVAPATAAPQQPAAGTSPGGTVLLVEDDDLVRSVTAETLRELGFSVLAAADGVEAVAELGKRPAGVSLVLCDLSMPGMNGWETLKALRAIAPGIPAILCSGYDKARVMAGRDPELTQGFLLKPYGTEDLSEAIRRALGAAASHG